jgi:hypothetical protein
MDIQSGVVMVIAIPVRSLKLRGSLSMERERKNSQYILLPGDQRNQHCSITGFWLVWGSSR